MAHPTPSFVYFGGEPLGVPVLEALKQTGVLPTLIVANPDRPAGRTLQLTPPPVKVWAIEHGIPVFQPTSYTDRAALTPLTETQWDLFVVVAYNFILPEWLITLPAHQTLNVHPSLLPQYRGANPIRTAIIDNNRAAIGVSIMQMDAQMDTGPIVAQVPVTIPDTQWPISGLELDAQLAHAGGVLLAQTIHPWLAGDITPTPQDHTQATYTKKLHRADGELAFDPLNPPRGEAAFTMLCTIRAYAGWPGTFFMYNNMRIKIIDAHIDDQDTLVPTEVTPEGKQRIPYQVFLERFVP